MIRIRSKTDGFMRCGVRHPSDWKEHPDSTFTPEQMEILKAEPMLQVEEIKAAPELTVPQIKAKLAEMNVEIPASAKNKADFQALLDQALAETAKKEDPAKSSEG
jgi:hypothetical protein